MTGLVGGVVPAVSFEAVAGSPPSPPRVANHGAAGAPAAGPQATLADGEVPGLRTAASRTFRLPGGVYQARVYGHPVNFRDAHGAWRRIDDRVVATGTGGWHNAANSVQVSLPATAAGPISVSSGADGVGFTLLGAAPAAGVASGDTVTYRGARPGLDMVEQVSDTGVKESLVLSTATAARGLEFTAALAAGQRLEPTGDGGLMVTDASGAPRWRVRPPVAVDAAGARSTSAVSYAVHGEGAGRTLSVQVDQAWLADPSRVFPVTVDPTVDAFGPSQETYLYSGAPTTSYGAASTDLVGKDAGGEYRLLVKYDVAAALPAHVDVLDTSLMSNSFTASNGPVDVAAYQLARSWTTAATWNSYDGTHAWTSAGGDLTGAAIDTESTPSGSAADKGRWYYLQSLASQWLTGATANDGLMLVEAGSTASVLGVPQGDQMWLNVNYVYRTGIRGAFTYYQRPLTDTSSLRVNAANGNLVLAAQDLDVTGVGVALTVDRYYNSQGDANPAAGGGLPLKWSQGLGRDVKLDDTYGGTSGDTDGELYYGPSGDAYWFSPDFANRDPDGSGDTDNFTSPPGINATLADEEGTQYRTLSFHAGGQVDRFGYFGLLDSVSDRNGNQISFTYSTPLAATSQLTGVTDTQGRTFSVSYNGSGYESALTDGNLSPSRSWSYGYTSGYLTSATDPAGATTQYGYDANGLLDEVTDGRGNTTTITYTTDGTDRVASLEDPGGDCAATPATGCVTFAYHDGSPASPCTVSGVYGSSAVTDENGHTTTYCYDRQDRILQTVDADGHDRSTSYTPNDDVTSLTDGLSNVFSLGYDNANNLTSLTRPGGTCDQSDFTASSGCSAQLTYPTPTGGLADFQPSSATDGQGNCTSYAYDAAGNLTDAHTGQTAGTTGCAGGTGGTHLSNAYQGDSGVADCGPSGAAAKPGQLCASTDGAGHTTSYTYDGDGNLTTITPPAPLGATSVTVDGDGRPTLVTDGAGRQTGYGYDGDGRISVLRFDGGSTASCSSTDAAAGNCIGYTYDGNGNLTGRLDNTGTTSWTYDTMNRPLTKTFPSAITSVDSAVSYDPVGNVTSYTDVGTGSGQVSYGYDAANNLTSVAEPGGSCPASPTFPNATRCTAISYTNANQRDVITYPSGQSVDMGYDDSGRLTSITGKRPAGTVFVSRSYTYTVGAKDTDLRTSVTDQSSATTHYGYDGQDRLCWAGTATFTSCTATTGRSDSYAYDAAGNMTASVTGATSSQFGYNNADELCWSASSTGSMPSPGSACTANPGPTGATDYLYDGAGNLCWTAPTTGASYTCSTRPSGATAYTYNAKSQTVGIGATTLTYADIGQAERTSTNGTTTYVNGLLGLTARYNGSSWVDFTRTPDGALLTLRQGNGTSSTNSHYTDDALGSTLALTAASGTSDNATYTYDPYGQTTATGTLSATNPWQYAGGYSTISLPVDKFGDRYYQPSLARWTQPDPIPGSITRPGAINRYPYASDNPTNLTDPQGRSILGDVLGSVVGGIGIAAETVNVVALVSAYSDLMAATTFTQTAVGLGLTFGAFGAIAVVGVGTGLAAYEIFKNT